VQRHLLDQALDVRRRRGIRGSSGQR
jgi:hypothetical protein